MGLLLSIRRLGTNWEYDRPIATGKLPPISVAIATLKYATKSDRNVANNVQVDKFLANNHKDKPASLSKRRKYVVSPPVPTFAQAAVTFDLLPIPESYYQTSPPSFHSGIGHSSRHDQRLGFSPPSLQVFLFAGSPETLGTPAVQPPGTASAPVPRRSPIAEAQVTLWSPLVTSQGCRARLICP
jgi:hypothetical protein